MPPPGPSAHQEQSVSALLIAPTPPIGTFQGFCLRTQEPTTTYYADSSATLCEVLSGLVDAGGVRQSTVHSTSSIERPRPTPSPQPQRPADANGAVCVSDAAPAIRWRIIPLDNSSIDLHIEYLSTDNADNGCVWHRSLPSSMNADGLSRSWHRRRTLVDHMATLATDVLKSDADARQRWEGLESGRISVGVHTDHALPYDFISADAREQLSTCGRSPRNLLDARVFYVAATSKNQEEALERLIAIQHLTSKVEYVRELDGERAPFDDFTNVPVRPLTLENPSDTEVELFSEVLW